MYKILYLRNPDPVFFTDLDTRLQQVLVDLNCQVQEVDLNSIHIEWESNAITFYSNGQPLEFDGLLNWGYMSPKHMSDYEYLINAVDAAGKVCLHTPRADHILQNKLIQGLQFAKAGVPIPKSVTAFTVPSIKVAAKRNFQFEEKGVVKAIDGYGGDGIMLARCSDETISLASKELWKGHQTVMQKFVPDSLGKSVRALCMNGKVVAACQYTDQDSDFRSNNGYNEHFKLVSLMDQKQKYEKVALDAISSIDPNLCVGGVDILDSQQFGLQVLEVNGWPDLWDTEKSSGVNTFQEVGQSFLARLERHYKLQQS